MRDYMRVMGLKEVNYWVCWFIYYLGVSTSISIVCTVLISSKVLPNSSPFLLFLLFFLYGLSHFGYLLLL